MKITLERASLLKRHIIPIEITIKPVIGMGNCHASYTSFYFLKPFIILPRNE